MATAKTPAFALVVEEKLCPTLMGYERGMDTQLLPSAYAIPVVPDVSPVCVWGVCLCVDSRAFVCVRACVRACVSPVCVMCAHVCVLARVCVRAERGEGRGGGGEDVGKSKKGRA